MRKTSVLVLFLFAVLAVAGPKTITVGSPRAGDVLCKGKSYKIQWASSGVGDRVKVQLISRTGVAISITKTIGIENDGLLEYTPRDTTSEGTYTIAVSSMDGTVRGISGAFRIDPCLATLAPPPPLEIVPTISIERQNEHNAMWVGGAWKVNWTTIGRMPELVNIYLYPPGCSGTGTLLATARTSARSQWVRFPETLAGGYYSFWVGQPGTSLSDCSERIQLHRQLMVTEPYAATVWHRGESVVVRWRRESAFITPLVDINLWREGMSPGTFYSLAYGVPETACLRRVTIPNDIPLGTYILVITFNGSGGTRSCGPESEPFQIVAR